MAIFRDVNNGAIHAPSSASSSTSTPIDNDNIEWLRGLPKVELHLHLEGTITPTTLVQLSQRHDATPLTLPQATALYEYTDFLHFISTFKFICQRLRTPDDYALIVHEMARDLAWQGVIHAEVYIAMSALLRDQTPATIASILAAIDLARIQAETEFGLTLFWIIDATRQYGADHCRQVFTFAAESRQMYPSLVGVGIGGDEVAGPNGLFTQVYAEARAAGLRLTAHAGESAGPIQGPRNIRDAITMGAKRIGHGMCAVHDDALLDELKDSQTPIEVCVTSNLRTGLCESVDNHPIRQMVERGLCVTIHSDDPAMFGSNLLDEYGLVQRLLGLSRVEVKELAKAAVKASFLTEDRRMEILQKIDDYET